MTTHDRNVAYFVAGLAWMGALALLPVGFALVSLGLFAQPVARMAFRYGRHRLRIPILDRTESEA